ncbi:cell wall-active antibiotics response protein LiaF [Paenibacillus guangzhouensis]|uniref:cell wall-active antibiotics response protein LiaF n=1 Tax=Paenibacillus guangzhouensis TaxID=1473112 RepID=UPI00126740E0|nr:cell wall-active antibiotics response protein LiaF [Paenibacillus guangzhouensis]
MHSGFGSRLFGGLILVGIGVVFLLNQMGYVHIDIGYVIRTYWPVILILAGLKNVVSHKHHEYGRSVSFGNVVLILIGGYFLARNLDVIHLSAGDFFRYLVPLMLILIGLYVILKPRRSYKKHDPHFHIPPEPYGMTPPPPPPPPGSESPKSTWKEDFEFGWQGNAVNKSGFIGDLHMGSEFWELKPMNISHFIGDTVLDLTKAHIPYGETRINVSSFIGDVKVYVPNDIEVGVAVSCSAFHGDVKLLDHFESGFMKNIRQETPYYNEASKKVRIIVSTFIGDVKVNKVG